MISYTYKESYRWKDGESCGLVIGQKDVLLNLRFNYELFIKRPTDINEFNIFIDISNLVL